MLLKLLYFLYLVQYFVYGITTHSRFHHQLYTNQDHEGQDKRSSEILDEQKDQSNESQENLGNQNLPNDITRKANPGSSVEQSKNNIPNVSRTPGALVPSTGEGKPREEIPSQSKESGMGQRTPGSNDPYIKQGIPGRHKAPGSMGTSMEQDKPSGQMTPGSNKPTIGQGNHEGQKPSGSKESGVRQGKPGIQKTPGPNEPTMGPGNLGEQKPSGSRESGMGQGKPGELKSPGSMEPSMGQGKPGGHKIPGSNEPAMGQGKHGGQKAPGSMEPSMGHGESGGQKTPGSMEPSKGQSKPELQKPSGSKESGVKQGKPGRQRTPGPNEPTMGPSNLGEQKPSGSKESGMGQGKPGGLKSPGSMEPSMGQGKPGGHSILGSNEPAMGQGKPGGQKAPGSMESSMGQGKPGGQTAPGSNAPGIGQGKPGGQTMPGSNAPDIEQGKPGGQKSPGSTEPSKGQGKPEGPKTPGSVEASMGPGKPGQQKPPGSTLPSTRQGKPGEQKTPESKEPSLEQGKPGEQTAPGSKEPSIRQGKPGEQEEQLGSKEPSASQVPDMVSSNVECPGNKSLHSRNDIKVMINYLYKNLSIDEKIRTAYQSHAFSLRDKYLEDLKKFNSWFHNQPEHLKHVLQSLGNVRLQLVEPRVKKIAKLLKDNSEMDQIIEEKKNRLRLITKKLRRYERLCSYNCEEQEDREERSLFKRQIQDEYFCSSIEDLYKKINEKLSHFVERFNNQSNDRFAKDNETYHIRIDNIKNKLRDKGLEMFGRTMYDILHLQDEYHHYVDHLNVTSLEMEINLAKNLNIQVDSKLLELNEHVETYGQFCKNCGGGDLKRSVRQTNSNPGKTNSVQIMRKKSETLVDSLLDEKFDESAIRVHNDWDKIFEGLNELINTTESETPQLGKFKPIQEEIMKMTKEEREALKGLKSTASDMVTQKAIDWIKLLKKLLKIIMDIINHIISLKSQHK